MVDWSIGGKDKHKVLYVQKVSGISTVVKTRRINPIRVSISFKDRSFPFYSNTPAFRRKNTFFYIVDTLTGQLNLTDADNKLTPEIMDKVIKKNVVQQLVSGLEATPWSTLIVYIILALGMGVSLGYILGNFVPIG